jgi:hypothetical protein
MAEVFIQNMRDPGQVVGITITIKRTVVAEAQSGNPMWILEGSTTETDSYGNEIPPVKKWLSNKSTLSEDVRDIIDQLCDAINWTYIEDTTPPSIVSVWPFENATGISVGSDIYITLSEEVPSSGIDLDSIQVKVKGFDLTDQVTIKGNMTSCSVSLTPGTKYQSAINEDFHNGSEYTPD